MSHGGQRAPRRRSGKAAVLGARAPLILWSQQGSPAWAWFSGTFSPLFAGEIQWRVRKRWIYSCLE